MLTSWQRRPKAKLGELAAAIRVRHQAVLWSSQEQRHVQRVGDEPVRR